MPLEEHPAAYPQESAFQIESPCSRRLATMGGVNYSFHPAHLWKGKWLQTQTKLYGSDVAMRKLMRKEKVGRSWMLEQGYEGKVTKIPQRPKQVKEMA